MSPKKKSSKAKFNRGQYGIISTVIFVAAVLVFSLFYYYVLPKIKAIKTTNGENVTAAAVVTKDITYEELANSYLLVHFISVGQADAIFIEFPTGHNMLIDAAEEKSGNKVVEYISSLGVTKLDYVLLTHQDSDHCGGMTAVYNAFEVKYSFRPATFSKYGKYSLQDSFNIGLDTAYCSTTKAYYDYLVAVANEGTPWSAFNRDSDINFELKVSEDLSYVCSLDFLSPTAIREEISYDNANNFSPIISLSFGGKKVLLTGDAESETENEVLECYSNNLSVLDADVLKVGHHGSKTSSKIDFLSAVTPEYAVISCGYDPASGKRCPWQVTLDNLFNVNSAILRTDLSGNIVYKVNYLGEDGFTYEKDCTFAETMVGYK